MTANSTRRFNIEGKDLGYPTHFEDGTSTFGLFLVPSRVANQLIVDSGFQVEEIFPGKAALSISCVHYTDTACGAYEEIAIAFFVKRLGKHKRFRIPFLSSWKDFLRGDIPSYTWRLPVSSTLARDCGIDMWGFPKTLETIDYELAGSNATTTWRVDGEVVLGYSVPATGNKQPATVSPPVYSVFEGRTHVSYLTQDYRDVGYHRSGAELFLGEHPVVDDLRRLGLPKKPLLALFNGHLSFDMSAPELL
jgi:hypothetical protein